MLAYDYLKQRPQIRFDQIKGNWADLFVDDNTPYAVKQELKEMELRGIVIKDSSLYWHKQVKYTEAIGMKNIDPDVEVYNSKWTELLYSIVQNSTKIDKLFDLFLLLNKDIVQLDIDYDLLYKITNYIYYDIYTIPPTIYIMYIMAIQNMGSVNELYSSTINRAELICKYSTRSLIKSSNEKQLREIAELIIDIDQPKVKFKSLNEIHKAHDDRTATMSKELILKAGDNVYVYHPELQRIAEEYGFFMPAGPASMVKRGIQHNNCVSTYANKQICNFAYKPRPGFLTESISRLFFTNTGTLELNIEAQPGGKIVSTSVLQFKGRFNKDIDRTQNLIDMRIALVGMDADILIVKEEVKGDKDQDNWNRWIFVG
jgi:hypothetical protein